MPVRVCFYLLRLLLFSFMSLLINHEPAVKCAVTQREMTGHIQERDKRFVRFSQQQQQPPLSIYLISDIRASAPESGDMVEFRTMRKEIVPINH